MKKEIIISGLLLLLGFLFEFLYFKSSSAFFDLKFWVLGIVCVIAGALGLWIYALLPLINKWLEGEKPS